MRFTRQMLEQQAKNRPVGYVEDVLSHATETAPGRFLLSKEAVKGLRAKYRAKAAMGLGDAVATVAQPIAKQVDKLRGSSPENGLANCTPCAKRRARLNELIPDVKKLFRT